MYGMGTVPADRVTIYKTFDLRSTDKVLGTAVL